MLENITQAISNLISQLGYPGLFIGMTLESALIPIPSEAMMTFSGYLAWQGRFNLWVVILVGAVANLVGSAIAYELGRARGKEWAERWGKYILLSHHDLEVATRWLARWGAGVSFFSRFIPGVRTYISFPAGIAAIPRGRFWVYSFLGSLGWSAFLAGVGYTLGPRWHDLGAYLRGFDVIVLLLLVAGAIWYIRRHIKRPV